MLALIKKNVIPLGIAAVALAVLYYFFASGGEEPLLTSTQEESPVSQEILVSLGNLRNIKLDDSVFSDPLFLSLSDFGVTIPPATAGRRNPFAPVGTGGSLPPAPSGTSTGTSTSQ